MSNNYFEMIGKLATEVKNDGRSWKVIAKRIIDNFDENVDYSRYKMLCPFHNDKHKGNFEIKRNHFNCFSCGEEGSTIDFIMKFDNFNFQEATIQAAYELDIIDNKTYDNLTKGQSIGITYQKREVMKEIKNELASQEELHYVYSLFSKGLTWLNKPILKEEHLIHLKKNRNLTDEEIEERGYFTFPSIYVLKHIIKQMREDGVDENLLYHIPGFFYDVKKEKSTFMLIKNNGGIGIPIKNAYGLIIGIQIRLDTIKEGEQRYIWFSSSFAITKDFIKGTSPGTPVDVCYPSGYTSANIKDIKCQTIFITEGHFKAIKLARTFNTIALSVQGVHNWRNIPYVLDYLKCMNHKFKHIYIMYDADMSYKESVLQPAIKLGLSLTNLSFKGYKTDIEDILSINRKYKTPLIELENNFKAVDCYLRKNAGVFKFDITYCLWNDDIGKGIDDYLETFENLKEATKGIMKIQIIQFWNFAYHYLRLNEETKEMIKLREGVENISDIVLSDDVKKENFEQCFFKNE